MRFLKTGNIYKIIRITGSQDNILGISFVEINSSEANLEVIEGNFPNVYKSLGTNYKLSKIYFSPFDSSKNRVYSGLIGVLIKHYHSGNEFKEVS
jgi:hypothetical protein